MPCIDDCSCPSLLFLPTSCSESWATFRYVTEQTNWAWGVREAARVSGAVLMWRVGKGMPAKYGITGDLREALYK
jgi:microsomal prostaglandin-E synthase 2